MPRRECVERQQLVPIFLQTGRRLRIFGLIGLQKEVEGVFRFRLRLRLPDVPQRLFRLGLNTLWEGIQDIARLMAPTAL